MNVKFKIPFLFIIIAGLFMFGCEKETSPPILHAPPVPEEKRLPVDYVLLLDNSGSIPRGEARVFAREAIKAFIDLTDPEDRASIILFDQDARVIDSVTIQDEADRNHLKETVESQLTFQGSHTDISKGIALVRKESSTLFREPGAAKPAIILISDGRLEPKENLQTAYQRLTQDWQALSDLVPFYTLGLGETEIYKEFLPNVTGHSLLTQMAQESGGRFYPVRSVEELVETCGKVLRHTKGYGEPAEQEVFRTDESTSRLAFLVIKRLPAQRLCRTGEILLQEPGGKQIDFSQSAGYGKGKTRILWHRGEYYDLIVVESPTSGEWSMSLSSGQSPRAVALIRNSVHLRYMVQREYWDQEKKVVMACLYDERTGVLSQRPCIISAKFDSGENFQHTDNKLNLHESKEKTYLTSLSLAEKEPLVGQYLVQIQAEDKKSFFLRRSPVVSVKVNDAYFSFDLPKGSIQKWPMLWKGLTFCVELDSQHHAYPSFREPPKISLLLEKVKDEKSASLSPVELLWQKKENRIEYRLNRADYPLGHYVARVVLDGRLVSGRSVRVESPEAYFVLLFPVWVWAGIAIIGLTGIVFLLFLFRPKLQGRLNFAEPVGRKPVILTKNKKAKKSLKGDSLRFGKPGQELADLHQRAFTITAARGKRLRIKVDKGPLSLIRDGQTKPIAASDLYRSDVLKFDDNGIEYVIEIICPGRRPRKKAIGKKR